MATDYEKFYRENRHGLGEPTREFVTFFDAYDRQGSRVLDVGCGQGRDALFIARLGHYVHAIDLSPSGIDDLQKDATAEGLAIGAEVVDVREFKTRRRFDVIVLDRMLHMLAPDERKAVLHRLLGYSKRSAFVLIADERSNIPAYRATLQSSRWKWSITLGRRGLLFAQRA